MLETALVKHCAPTLARLKPGNMFVLSGLDGREAAREMRALNRLLAPKGVALTVLRRRGGKTLFYLYRPDELAAILGAEAARAFLRRCGYGEFGSERRCACCAVGCARGKGFPTRWACSSAIRWRTCSASSATAGATACCAATGRSTPMPTAPRARSRAFANAKRCMRASFSPAVRLRA